MWCIGMRSDAQVTHERRDARQQAAFGIVRKLYGEDRVSSRRYQAIRTAEEFFELMQTQGLALEKLIDVARDVYSRPAGDTKTEVGDLLFSLDCMCENLGVSADTCHTNTIQRVAALDPAKTKAKDDAKIARGLI